MRLEELAHQVIAMFDLQRAYFRLKPDDSGKRAALEKSKAAEKALKAECQRIIEGPSLFGEDR